MINMSMPATIHIPIPVRIKNPKVAKYHFEIGQKSYRENIIRETITSIAHIPCFLFIFIPPFNNKPYIVQWHIIIRGEIMPARDGRGPYGNLVNCVNPRTGIRRPRYGGGRRRRFRR